MPTYGQTESFKRDHATLTAEHKVAFRKAVDHLVEDLPKGRFRKGLRVKGVKGASGIYEMTWAADGRATFEYGPPEVEGETHIIWRRIGTHDIFRAP